MSPLSGRNSTYRPVQISGTGSGFISERFHIVNANKAQVPTTPFVDQKYSGVSALIGCAAERCYGKPLDLHVVHNPRADVPLPLGTLGGQDDEWFATAVGGASDEFDLQRAPFRAAEPAA